MQKEVTLTTEPAKGPEQTNTHVHTVKIVRWQDPNVSWKIYFSLLECDGKKFICPDGHDDDIDESYTIWLDGGNHEHYLSVGWFVLV